MNPLVAPEIKSFSHLYLEILRLSPDITRRATLPGSPAEHADGQDRGDGFQIRFRGKWFGLRAEFRIGEGGRDGSRLNFGIPHRDLRLLGTGWAGVDTGELAGRRGGGFADTHKRLSPCCQPVVWFLTRRPGAVPGLVVCYLPEAGPDCREVQESGFGPEGGESISGRAVRTLGCSRPSTGRVPTTPENGCLDSIH